MSNNTLNSLRNMCRTCMSNTEEEYAIKSKQCIYEVPAGCKEDASIMDLLQVIQPQIKVQIKDDLPKLMCSDCIKKLIIAYEFLEMYRKVNKKFRKMLEGSDNNNSKNVRALDNSLESIEKKDHFDQTLDDEENVNKLTKFEIEIEEMNEEDFDKEEMNEEDWPEFEETLDEISNETEENDDFVNNSYSDASDNDWTQNESQKYIPESTTAKKRKTEYEVNVSTTLDFNSTKTLRKGVYKKPVKNLELYLPPQNKDGSISCQECESLLGDITLWQKHMRQHHLEKIPKRKYTKKTSKSKKDYECEHCGKVFPKITAYKNHVRTHTGEEPYLCIECGKSFKVVSSLNTHMLRHKGEKTVQCPHCPKKFVCSSGLYGHMMVHTKEKPFVCDICGSAFHMAYQLRKHNLYHNGIKNYQCEYCDMRFVTGEKQRRHMRTHTGEKPYRCKYCERAFAQSNDCIKHLRQHLGDNVYQCELCPLRFPLARDLRAHFASHKDDDEETRARNLQARIEEERNLQIKLGVQET